MRTKALQEQIYKCKEEIQRIEETNGHFCLRRMELGAMDSDSSSGSTLGTSLNGGSLLKELFNGSEETEAQGCDNAGDNAQVSL